MIVGILPQIYKCGCGKGIHAIKYLSLLEYLNEIIDWSKCKWPEEIDKDATTDPEKPVMKENTEFLGNPPQLKPGNCILWDGNVIALDDSDTAILVVSETGPLSIERFKTAVENEMSFYDNPRIKCERVEKEKPEETEAYRTGYSKWSIIKEKINNEPETLKVVDEETLLFPITVWVEGADIIFDPQEVDREAIEMLSGSIYLWLSANKKVEEN